MSKPHVTEGFPFDETTLVFKVMNKMFLLTDLEDKPLRMNVKCDPERAIELREQYESVIPGYHMDKKHWNTVIFDGSLDDEELKSMIDDSYGLIVAKLPKKVRDEYNNS